MRSLRFIGLTGVWLLATTGMTLGQQSTTTNSGADAGSTTEALGETTGGVTRTGTSDVGTAGSNATDGFVGGNNAEDLVGGSRQATDTAAANRFFRAITGQEVPTGGTSDGSADPRRVPVTLRLGFAAPAPRAALGLAGSHGVDFAPFNRRRPELRAVGAVISDAGIVTLRGRVPDAATKRLASNLVRLQPGVRGVDNQIKLTPVPRTISD